MKKEEFKFNSGKLENKDSNLSAEMPLHKESNPDFEEIMACKNCNDIFNWFNPPVRLECNHEMCMRCLKDTYIGFGSLHSIELMCRRCINLGSQTKSYINPYPPYFDKWLIYHELGIDYGLLKEIYRNHPGMAIQHEGTSYPEHHATHILQGPDIPTELPIINVQDTPSPGPRTYIIFNPTKSPATPESSTPPITIEIGEIGENRDGEVVRSQSVPISPIASKCVRVSRTPPAYVFGHDHKLSTVVEVEDVELEMHLGLLEVSDGRIDLLGMRELEESGTDLIKRVHTTEIKGSLGAGRLESSTSLCSIHSIHTEIFNPPQLTPSQEFFRSSNMTQLEIYKYPPDRYNLEGIIHTGRKMDTVNLGGSYNNPELLDHPMVEREEEKYMESVHMDRENDNWIMQPYSPEIAFPTPPSISISPSINNSSNNNNNNSNSNNNNHHEPSPISPKRIIYLNEIENVRLDVSEEGGCIYKEQGGEKDIVCEYCKRVFCNRNKPIIMHCEHKICEYCLLNHIIISPITQDADSDKHNKSPKHKDNDIELLLYNNPQLIEIHCPITQCAKSIHPSLKIDSPLIQNLRLFLQSHSNIDYTFLRYIYTVFPSEALIAHYEFPSNSPGIINHISCAKCLKYFTEKNIPVSIKCGHNICANCASELFDKLGSEGTVQIFCTFHSLNITYTVIANKEYSMESIFPLNKKLNKYIDECYPTPDIKPTKQVIDKKKSTTFFVTNYIYIYIS